jgi:hypothetical protein
LLGEDLLKHLYGGRTVEAHRLWIGLGRPVRIGNIPLLEAQHRLFEAKPFKTRRDADDFAIFASAVQKTVFRLADRPGHAAASSKAVLLPEAGPLLKELCELEGGH